MKVVLLAHTPDAERVIAAAAKLCYAPVGADTLYEDLDDTAVSRFLKGLVDMGHESPIEHVSFTFGIQGVSRTLTHQLVRHRLASYSQQSQRYVRLESFEYIVPPAIAQNPEAYGIFMQAMAEDQAHYSALVETLIAQHQKALMAEGMPEARAFKVAEKQAIEDARYVFPNACETKIVVTMNARSLMHFFKQRCCNRAQWEIRALATEMLRTVRTVAPEIFKHAGPACLRGACPEGAMTCGQMVAVREAFSKL